jgi:hypothetical protein
MNPNYPAGFSQGEHDRTFGGERHSRISADICPGCELEIEERYRDLFYVDDRRCEPNDSSDGEICCSQTCLSQHEFDLLCGADQDGLRKLARAAYAWFVGTDCGQWKIQQSGISKLVPEPLFREAEAGMVALLKQLAGEGILNGDSDGPDWFQRAVGLIQEPLLIQVRPAVAQRLEVRA